MINYLSPGTQSSPAYTGEPWPLFLTFTLHKPYFRTPGNRKQYEKMGPNPSEGRGRIEAHCCSSSSEAESNTERQSGEHTASGRRIAMFLCFLFCQDVRASSADDYNTEKIAATMWDKMSWDFKPYSG
ncbi:hypothetical protein STEG23_003782 [Scotinomys teguina]